MYFLRVFGSLCFKHILYARRKKLEDKSEQGDFDWLSHDLCLWIVQCEDDGR